MGLEEGAMGDPRVDADEPLAWGDCLCWCWRGDVGFFFWVGGLRGNLLESIAK